MQHVFQFHFLRKEDCLHTPNICGGQTNLYGKLEWSESPLQECAILYKQNTNVDTTQILSMTFEILFQMDST